jgi:hypothetical protein
MICDNCTHSDGKYCICGIIEEGDIEISKIGKMVDRIFNETGGLVDWDGDHCPYYEEDDMDGYNEDMAWESEHGK